MMQAVVQEEGVSSWERVYMCVMIELMSSVRFQLMGSLWLLKEDGEDMKCSPHPTRGQPLRNV